MNKNRILDFLVDGLKVNGKTRCVKMCATYVGKLNSYMVKFGKEFVINGRRVIVLTPRNEWIDQTRHFVDMQLKRTRINQREYYKENRENRLAKAKEKYKAGLTNKLEQARLYYKNNRDKVLENYKEKYKNNIGGLKDKCKAYNKKYKESHKEEIKQYYQKRKELISKRNKELYRIKKNGVVRKYIHKDK